MLRYHEGAGSRLDEHEARYAADGRIGLTVVPGGIATPPFGPDERTVGVLAGELTVSFGNEVRTAPITTVPRGISAPLTVTIFALVIA